MEKDNNITILTTLSYYTEGFNTELIFHIINIMNKGRNFKSDFEYSFKIDEQKINVTFDSKNDCLNISITNGIDTLIVSRYTNHMDFIRTTNDGTFKATLDNLNGKITISTEEITEGFKLELKEN